MSFRGQDIKHIFYPWAFVLKEGEMNENRLDYSLMLLQIGQTEIVKSPKFWTPPKTSKREVEQ